MNRIKLLPVLFLMAACGETENPTAEPVEVTFNVNGLGVTVDEMDPPVFGETRSPQPLSDAVSSISYYIFDASTSKLVKSGRSSFIPGMEPVPDDFGTVKIKIMPGKYQIIFTALGKGDGEMSINGISDGFNSDSHFSMVNREVFYLKQGLEVNTNSSNFNFHLPRISGLLRLHVTDEATPDIKRVVISIGIYERWHFMFPSLNELQRYRILNFEGVLADGKMELFEYHITRPQDVPVSIKIYGANDVLLGEKKRTAPIYENRKTIVSGELFSLIGAKDFSVTVSDEWDADYVMPL